MNDLGLYIKANVSRLLDDFKLDNPSVEIKDTSESVQMLISSISHYKISNPVPPEVWIDDEGMPTFVWMLGSNVLLITALDKGIIISADGMSTLSVKNDEEIPEHVIDLMKTYINNKE